MPDLDNSTTRANSSLRTFSRWARGGLSQDELTAAAGVSGFARRGFAQAARPHSAQSIVEFMLISVPLLALIFGIMEFGIAFFESTTLDYTTRNVARSIQVCADQCDVVVSNTVLYRDYYALKTVRESTLSLDKLEYILIQHVGEQQDVPTVGQTDYGRAGPDIYANYKYHYQLYAPPKTVSSNPNNNVTTRPSDPSNFILNDTTADKVGINLPTNGDTANNNGWRSVRCIVPFQSYDPNCRQSVPPANENGSQNTSNTAPPSAPWPGRYTCIPTDRFYVQIAYKHYWITPFMPSIDTTSRNPTLQGFSNNNAITLNSVVYQKVEPILYSGAGTCYTAPSSAP